MKPKQGESCQSGNFSRMGFIGRNKSREQMVSFKLITALLRIH